MGKEEIEKQIKQLIKQRALAGIKGNYHEYRQCSEEIKRLEALPVLPIPLAPSLHHALQLANIKLDSVLFASTTRQSAGGSMSDSRRKFQDGDWVEISWSGLGVIGQVKGYDGGDYAIDFVDSSDLEKIKTSGLLLGNCYGMVPSQKGVLFSTSYLQLATDPHTKVDFGSVIMADDMRQQILEALEQVNKQKLIFEVWGFGETIEKGRGVSMLFWGEPGTGKTLTAQAIADNYGYTLRIIGPADLESSEPGQAERNIRDLFKTAEKDTVLLFDECDSLLFDRTNLGAILGAQVNELLSCLERFEGITIFTTNRLETLDEAVNRRLALKLEFKMPDQEQRAEIWRRMFPKKAPLEDNIDFMKLGSVELAGGHIKNAVLRAARIAAADKTYETDKSRQITMKHLISALQQEGRSMIEFREQKAKFNVPRQAGGPRLGRIQSESIEKLMQGEREEDG